MGVALSADVLAAGVRNLLVDEALGLDREHQLAGGRLSLVDGQDDGLGVADLLGGGQRGADSQSGKGEYQQGDASHRVISSDSGAIALGGVLNVFAR